MKCKEFKKLITPYLRDELPEPRLSDFETHYFGCEECFRELSLIRNIQDGRNYHLLGDEPVALPRGWRLMLNPVALAASLLIVFFSIVAIYSLRRAPIPSISFEAPPFTFAENRNAISRDDDLGKGFALYNQKRYREAVSYFNSYPHFSAQVIFFRGASYLMAGEYQPAIADFDTILDQMNPSYYDDALYYKAVALIRLGRVEQGAEILRELTQIFSPLEKKAQQLLAVIE